MESPAIDLKDYLLDYSDLSSAQMEFVFGTNLFVGRLPETSVLCVCLFDLPGPEPDENNIRSSVIKIMVRGLKDYQTTWDAIELVSTIFHNLTEETINSSRYIQIRKIVEPSHVGNDEKGRPIFSCSLQAMRA